MIGGFQVGAFQPAYQQEAARVQTPAGRRRRYYVEIDGQQFVVNSAQEAQELLQRARAIAERQAETKAQVAEQNVTRIARRTGSVPAVNVPVPEITVSQALAKDTDVSNLISDIHRLYAKAAAEAELRILLQKQLDDDDEELLLL